MVTLERQDEMRLAEYLVERTLAQLTGRAEDVCRGDRPRNRYFVGSLANREPQDDADVPDSDLFSRMAPSAMGLEFLVQPGNADARVAIRASFSVYYRVFPDLNQQRASSGHDASASDTRQSTPAQNASNEWAVAYRKVPVRVAPVSVRLPQGVSGRTQLDDPDLQASLRAALRDVKQQIMSDPLRYRAQAEPRPVPSSVLQSEGAYAEFVRQTSANAMEIEIDWDVQLQVQVRPSEGGRVRVTVMLQNVSPDDHSESSSTDRFLFDVHLLVQGHNSVLCPFVFDVIPEDYRYDRELWGLGRNCSVSRVPDEDALVTENAPVYRQPVYTTRDVIDPGLPKATFLALAEDPIATLSSIAAAMEQYSTEWEESIARNQQSGEWSDDALRAARADLQGFVAEMARFRRGIDALARYDLLRRAFQLMNQAFVNASKYPSWRLFQVVYIVTQLPAIAAREYDDQIGRAEWDVVDVLWFPTGGGKTEAYFGLIVLAAFFDRLRGKKAGVTAWMKFPLRMLSLQQLQRLADIMGAAELLRRRTSSINLDNCDPFSVGYLVGSGNTPNKLTEYNGNGWFQRLERNSALAQTFLTIPRCPFCGQKSVRMDLEKDSVRLIHRCTNPECPEAANGGVLPIYIVDNEVYRYLPTVIAGTIDKVTAVGYERKFSHLFGAVSHRCPRHGYLSLGECTEKYGCDVESEEFERVSLKDPTPTLQIQDELHLLREELGAFDGHYETYLDTYQQRKGYARQKIVAATATIEEYENQISHLYDRGARRFPVPGPSLGRSFYATTLQDETRRLFVGIMPHNYTHINAVVRLAELYHREIENLRRDPQGAINRLGFVSVTAPDDFLAMLSNYEVFVSYLLSKREGDRLNQSYEGQLNRVLTDSGYTEVSNRSIIGETRFPEVAAILDELEKPALDFERRLRSVTATSTISHGVDVERLNCLCFFGMPRQTAEYIQTSSRAGRDHPGLVLVCFNPSRERDQSHYQFFGKYHEYLERLVEPVPINRWSKFSIRRTIPGLFMAIMLNDYNLTMGGGGKSSLYFSNNVRRLIESRGITPDEMIDYLRAAYRTAARDAGQEFDAVIQRKVNEYLDTLRNPADDFTSNNLTDAPMQSLRDVDEQLFIGLDRDSRMLFSSSTRRDA